MREHKVEEAGHDENEEVLSNKEGAEGASAGPIIGRLPHDVAAKFWRHLYNDTCGRLRCLFKDSGHA